jgi:hypothetical protein
LDAVDVVVISVEDVEPPVELVSVDVVELEVELDVLELVLDVLELEVLELLLLELDSTIPPDFGGRVPRTPLRSAFSRNMIPRFRSFSATISRPAVVPLRAISNAVYSAPSNMTEMAVAARISMRV